MRAPRGSPAAEKLRFQGSPTDLQNTAKDLGAGYDLNGQCEALGNSQIARPSFARSAGCQRTRVGFLGRVLNAISQTEPRLRHSQEVLPVIIVGGFVR